MFRIAVHDTPQGIEAIRPLLDRYKATRSYTAMTIAYFDTTDKLLHEIENDAAYDLFLLDAHGPDATGIALAEKIREADAEVSLVFTASSPEYALDAFRVYATQYFLKPVKETDLFPLLDRIVNLVRCDNKTFDFPMSDGTVKIPYDHIGHIEIFEHIMTVHLINGDHLISKTIRIPFADAIAPLLADERFLHVNRSFAINMAHVQKMIGNAFVMINGSSIPVTRYKVTEARTRYYEWRARHGIVIPVDRRSRIGGAAKRSAIATLVALLVLTALLNCSPRLAAAAYQIPVIGPIVKVLTFNRFVYEDNGYTAEIKVPEIRGLLDDALQERLNAEFRAYADELILAFEASVAQREEFGLANGDADVQPAHLSIKADYTVKTDNDRILAIDAYLYSDVTGFVVHKFCTIDKQTGTQVTLAGLFMPDADYTTPISDYLITEMRRQNEEEGALFDVGDTMFASFTGIRPDHNFYINDEYQLVICFDKYEVAAGFMGSPAFAIPNAVIADIASTDLLR